MEFIQFIKGAIFQFRGQFSIVRGILVFNGGYVVRFRSFKCIWGRHLSFASDNQEHVEKHF